MAVKVFKESGFEDVSELVLPIEEFKLCCELDALVFDEDKAKKTIEKAEKFSEMEIPLLPASLYRDLYITGSRKNYETLYFRRREILMYCALAEAYERKGRFLNKIMDTAWAIMEESSWIIPSHLPTQSPSHGNATLPPVFDSTRMHGLDLFSASTGALLALVYYYHKQELDKITPVICDKIKSMLKERIIKSYLNFMYYWTGERGNPVNNWGPWINSNVLFVNAIIEDTHSERVAVVNKALLRLDNFTASYEEDGGCPEGPSYWSHAGASFFDCCELIYDLTGGKVNVFSNKLLKNMCEYEPKVNIADRYYMSFGDCSAKNFLDGTMLRRMGEKLDSSMLYEFSKYISSTGDYVVDSSSSYRAIRNVTSPLVSDEKYYLPRFNYFPNLKVASIRENTYPKEGMFVGFKGGSNGVSHNHNDLGNYLIYYNGNPVVIDAGVGVYSAKTFSKERYELWYMNSSHHNTADIGGFAQEEGKEYVTTDETYDENTGAYQMQLKNAYPEGAGIISYIKRAELIGGKAIITEDIELMKESEIIFNILTCAEPAVIGKGKIKMVEDVILDFDSSLEPQIEAVDVDDKNLRGNWGDYVYRIRLYGKVQKGKFEFTFSH